MSTNPQKPCAVCDKPTCERFHDIPICSPWCEADYRLGRVVKLMPEYGTFGVGMVKTRGGEFGIRETHP